MRSGAVAAVGVAAIVACGVRGFDCEDWLLLLILSVSGLLIGLLARSHYWLFGAFPGMIVGGSVWFGYAWTVGEGWEPTFWSGKMPLLCLAAPVLLGEVTGRLRDLIGRNRKLPAVQ